MSACLVCATRGRTTRLDHGHVCAACLQRIADQLDDIVRLAALASIEPRNSRGGGRTIPASRPPLNIDGLDPALTLVNVGGAPSTVLETLESWERLIREARCMAPYGIASSTRATSSYTDTTATLTGVTGFLRASLTWWETEPDQPVADFAAETHACHRALAHYDPDREPLGYAAFCPTDGCGARLRYQRPDDDVTCPRCHVTRDVPQLVAVVLSSDAGDIWADLETAALHYGVSVSTLKRRASSGDVERRRGRYLIRRVATAATS